MADDTRKSLRVDPNATSFTNQQWNTAEPSYKPPENANMMPGGTENTAGGKTKDVSFLDGIKSIKADDWTNLHRKPCVRDSLLTGIGAGVATGSMRAIWRGMCQLFLTRPSTCTVAAVLWPWAFGRKGADHILQLQ